MISIYPMFPFTDEKAAAASGGSVYEEDQEYETQARGGGYIA